MNLVNYLTSIYGYDAPIFIKDVRIGRKSKSAIREEFYRAYKRGELERKGSGIYFVKSNKEFGSTISFEEILNQKFIYLDNQPPVLRELFVEGYYTGLTFLNKIGISQQVPAVLEVTTNKTSSKKRYYSCGKFVAIIRKPKTTITTQNYRMLQFLDMFHFLSMDEVKENKDLICRYVKDNQFSQKYLTDYLNLYSTQTIKKIVDCGVVDAFIE